MIPGIGACLLLLVFGLHLAAAGQSLAAAAAAAARAASLQPTPSSALAAARAEAETNLHPAAGDSHGCSTVQVEVDAAAFRPGGAAVVSLTCTLDLASLSGIGIPGHLRRTVTSTAPIDLYATTAQGR